MYHKIEVSLWFETKIQRSSRNRFKDFEAQSVSLV